MQFHLNGFRAGNPDHAEGSASPKPNEHGDEVDVLIVGCGPAGLTLAAQLAQCADIRTRIVEQKSGPMEKGQADGISCRSMEMFNAFGFSDCILREAYWVNETTFWKPDSQNPAHINRVGRVKDVEEGLSEMPHVILNQARVHDQFLEKMKMSPTALEPDYSRRLHRLTVDESDADYPVTVELERSDEGHEGEIETIRARYVIGCDGARSAVRTSIGRELRGDAANKAWGVMDVLAVTDFPDIRYKSLIQSSNEGNILIIPREGGYLVRLYIELDKLNPDERVRDRNITVDQLIEAANRIFNPYSLDVKDVVWWSVYEIGQRITDKFDNVEVLQGGELDQLPCVFIAGDACHTHSPKAGQGMNVSMGDTFNLGWKLIATLRGQCAPELLHSYSEERQDVAQALIDFDREWARIISESPDENDRDQQDGPPLFQKYFQEHGRYTAGVSVRYKPSVITGASDWQNLASGFEIGTRLHSAPVVRLADGKDVHLGHVINADGRWRLFAFASDQDKGGEGSQIRALADYLAHDPSSPARKYAPNGADPDAFLDLRVIFQQSHHALNLHDMPETLLPTKGKFGLKDYEKIFCAHTLSANDIFDMRSVDRKQGCMLLVRPDQYVAHILPLDASQELESFFSGFMIEQAKQGLLRAS